MHICRHADSADSADSAYSQVMKLKILGTLDFYLKIAHIVQIGPRSYMVPDTPLTADMQTVQIVQIVQIV